MYTEDEMRRFSYESIVPAHCTECEEYVCDAEPDARWTGGGKMQECPSCGEGTIIESIINWMEF